jgi:hypothetical protein
MKMCTIWAALVGPLGVEADHVVFLEMLAHMLRVLSILGG